MFKVEKPIQTFTGRETFLEDLHKVVKKSQITVLMQAPLSVVAATGGIGKTETLRMYIQYHKQEYDHVIWIDAEQNSSAKNQFFELASVLGISTDSEGKPKEFELIRDQIFEKLFYVGPMILLVFDNAEAFEDDEDQNLCGIRNLFPKSLSPSFVAPTVIVTSRNQNWNLQNVIQLDLWTAAEVIIFVIQRLELTKTPENYELATQLGNLFGRLPIALQAAVAVILQQIKRRKKYGISNLIDEYQNRSRRVLAQKPLDANMRPLRMSDTMLILWNISLEKIVKFQDGALAIKLLCLMAYLSPTRIPQEFLYALFQNDFAQESIENALEILEDYSLISTLSSTDSDSYSFFIHRMIQDSTVGNLRYNEERKPHSIFNKTTFLNETDVLLKLSTEAGNYIKTLETRKLSRGGEIVENLVHITTHVSKFLNVKEFRDLTAEVAEVLRKTNDFAKSIELYENVLTATPAAEVESEIHDKSQLKLNLAFAYSDGGFYHRSIELLNEVLKDQTRVLGPHHPVTLETKCSIATALRSMWKYDDAGAKFSEVLQDFQINQDTDSEAFMRTNGNIAIVLKEQGKLEEAAAMMLKNISDATRVFGPFHLHTFAFKGHYADLLCVQGKHEEAAQLYLELLEIKETELGSEHPDTLRTKNDLAVLYLNTEEPDKALPLLDVEVRERVLGPEHPHTMDTGYNLANVMTKQGKFGEALALHNKTLKLRKQVLGPNHPDSLTSMYNIGYVHYEIEEFDKASEVWQDLLLRQEEVLGKNHPSTIETLKWLTKCRKILELQNKLIANFMTLTSVDAEIGRSLLQASNWNNEAALGIILNSNSSEDIAGFEEQNEASISSRTTTDFQDQTLDVVCGNTTNDDQINDVEGQMETVPKRN